MKLSLENRKTSVALFLIAVITFGCEESNSSSESGSQSSKNETAQDPSLSQIKPTKDSVSYLDITFIERLASSWGSGFKDNRLALKGFIFKSIKAIKNGEEAIFENSSLKNQLTISRLEFSDGETFFTVKYAVSPEQLKRFEKHLLNTIYKQTEKGRYSKKGLGTYQEKVVTCNSKLNVISYSHRIGKEINPPMFPMYPIPEIRDIREILIEPEAVMDSI